MKSILIKKINFSIFSQRKISSTWKIKQWIFQNCENDFWVSLFVAVFTLLLLLQLDEKCLHWSLLQCCQRTKHFQISLPLQIWTKLTFSKPFRKLSLNRNFVPDVIDAFQNFTFRNVMILCDLRCFVLLSFIERIVFKWILITFCVDLLDQKLHFFVVFGTKWQIFSSIGLFTAVFEQPPPFWFPVGGAVDASRLVCEFLQKWAICLLESQFWPNS